MLLEPGLGTLRRQRDRLASDEPKVLLTSPTCYPTWVQECGNQYAANTSYDNGQTLTEDLAVFLWRGVGLACAGGQTAGTNWMLARAMRLPPLSRALTKARSALRSSSSTMPAVCGKLDTPIDTVNGIC